MKPDRPTFYLKNEDSPIRAGGVIFYYFSEKTVELLMIKHNNIYEDFGGKTDKQDKTFIDTVSREVDEESNGIFKKEEIEKKIKDKKPVYTKCSKYILYFIELDDKIDSKKFGTKEFTDNIYRTVKWIDINKFNNKKFVKENLNIRLKFKDFFKKIYELKNLNSNKFNFIL